MLVDTNVLVRHLTGDPPEQAERAGRLIAGADSLLVPDLVAAECFYVLTSVYGQAAAEAAEALRGVVRSQEVRVAFPELLERTLDHCCAGGLGFADGYLAALSQLSDAGPIASFDRGLDRVEGIERVEP